MHGYCQIPNDRLEIIEGHRLSHCTTVYPCCPSGVPRSDEPQHARVFLGTGAYRCIARAALCIFLWQPVMRFHVTGGGGRAAGCDPAYAQLDMIPSSEYYMANCHVLHSVDVRGPTAVSGWKRYVSGQPFVQSRNILIIGDSGTEIYGSSGKIAPLYCH